MSVQLTSHGINSPLWNAASNVVAKGGSAPSPPPPPPPPDYSAASRSGIITDINSLATRKAIENASIYGGEVLNYGVTASGGKFYQKYDEDGKELKSPKEITRQEAYSSFSADNSTIGASDKLADWQRLNTKENAQFGLDLVNQYGNQYIDKAKTLMERLDPEGTANRKELGDLVNNKLETISGNGPALEKLIGATVMEKATNAQAQERVGDAAALERIEGDGPKFTRGTVNDGGGQTQAIRSKLEQDILDNLASGENLTPSQIKKIEEQTRAAQVARGNATGNAATAAEIAAKYDFGTSMGQSRRAEALGLLSSGQSTYDTASKLRQEGNTLSQQELQNELTNIGQRNTASQQDLANKLATTQQRNSSAQIDYSNLLSSISQRNSAFQQDYANIVTQNQANNSIAQQGYQNQLTNIGQRNAAEQQRVANMSAYAGLAPVGAIASQTQGAQASPVWTGQPAQVMNLLGPSASAGNDAAKFALGVFDTQSRNYSSLLNYNASTYATNQQYNSPLSWFNGAANMVGSVGKLW